jgi:magnesium transporter
MAAARKATYNVWNQGRGCEAVRIYLEKTDGSIANPASLDGVSLSDAVLLWIDLENPTSDEISRVGALINAHPIALNHCKAPDGLPKILEFPNHLFVAWSFIIDPGDGEKLDALTLCLFLGENFLVTIHSHALPGVDAIWGKLAADADLYKHHPAPILYAILDSSVDEYFPIIEDITNKVDAYQDEIMSGVEGNLPTIMSLKHRNMAIRRAVASHRDVILKLQRRDMPFIPDDLSIYIMDVYDLLVRAAAEVDSNSDLITASLDINLNMVSNRLNEVMKKLTIVATIFLPLTFLVGVYGMNFKNMPELTWQYGYLASWIALAVIAVGTYFVARWFIERPPRRKRPKAGDGT